MQYNDEIIDTHMHLWDLRNDYNWLTTANPNMEKMFGDYSALRQDFLVSDYTKLAKQHNIIQAVHIEAFGFPEEPSHESKWLQQQADQHGFPNAIIGYAKLDDASIDEQLSRHTQYENMRGIRMVLNWHDIPHLRMTDRPDYMNDKNWLHGFSLLEKHNLLFELQVYDHQLVDTEKLAAAFPNTQIILEHMAWPTDFSADSFNQWQKRIAMMAKQPNVTMKLSGLGAVFQRKVANETVLKYIKTAIDTFGPDRCLFGSNFPPDGLFYSLDEIVNLMKKATEHLDYEAQRKLFFSNAKCIYKLS